MTQWKVCSIYFHQQPSLTDIKSKLNLGDKSTIDDKQASSRLKLGLFSYPVLQAADILVHRSVTYPKAALITQADLPQSNSCSGWP